MANVDRPNGFRPVKTLSGRPLNGMIRTIQPTAADVFIGDVLTISGGQGLAATAAGLANAIGVCVGVGKVDADGIPLGAYDPDNLHSGVRFFDTSAMTNTEYVLYYVPFNDVVFEAQFEDGGPVTAAAVGSAYDLVLTHAGNQTTGRSGMELEGANSGADFEVIELPNYPDNDPNDTTDGWGRVWVIVPQADQALI